MIDYLRYADVAGIQQKDMVEAVATEYPGFTKAQMSFACNPAQYALCLIPEAEKLLEDRFGKAPGLSISVKIGDKKHGNKNKPNRLYVRIDDSLRSRVQSVYESMCFASMQDMLEAAIADFVSRHERRA
jgi:hypothetical protein